ncbi:hypothetical protein OPT61_g479 [Boeremia exigua]|uniref:Uncharacterized protein n=1 Tax=Boeremia exigua TaxID=749465 RepID=A0ACC2ITL7_9PLEO|nr:hypothetical protein OPT61_g479 [Boeremia exigua]
MLRSRQKRRVIFANPQTQASSSKSAPAAATVPPATASASRRDRPKSRHACNDSTQASKRGSQQPSNKNVKVSNRQRRLASLFMALMASSPLPIETDAETLEAAQKASIAPKASADTKHSRRVSTIRVQEVRAGRWKRFRYELSLKTGKGKGRRQDDVELDELLKPSGRDKSWG